LRQESFEIRAGEAGGDDGAHRPHIRGAGLIGEERQVLVPPSPSFRTDESFFLRIQTAVIAGMLFLLKIKRAMRKSLRSTIRQQRD
jgi:hypothetical protein